MSGRAGYSITVPERLIKFLRRLVHLQAGRRYMIVLTLPGDGEIADWTITEIGKVEK